MPPFNQLIALLGEGRFAFEREGAGHIVAEDMVALGVLAFLVNQDVAERFEEEGLHSAFRRRPEGDL